MRLIQQWKMNTTKDKLKLCHMQKTFCKACSSSSAKSTIKYAGHQVGSHFLNMLSSVRNPQLGISHWFGHTERIKARHILWCDKWHPTNTFHRHNFLAALSAQLSDDRIAGSGPQNLMVQDQGPHWVGCLLGHLS